MPFKFEISEIKLINKDVDYPNRIIFIDINQGWKEITWFGYDLCPR